MSEKLPQNQSNEEVDLGQLFNAIGKLFEKLFSFVSRLFRELFSVIIYALKPLVNNFKLITIVLMIAAVLGFVSEKFKKPVYFSDMLVKPYFDSKYQLANNVNYFNALIGSKNLERLSTIFEIDVESAEKLIGFEIEIGPETQNDLLKEYDDYVKSIDSTLAVDVTYEEFIDNRDILAGNIFSIKAKSSSNDIFPSLEKGFIKTFENNYSKKLKRITDSTRLVRKGNYEKELRRIDSLQKMYIGILKNESEEGKISIGPSSLFPLTKEKTTTKEYELFKEELLIRKALGNLEELIIEESSYYDILSSFEDVGSRETSLYDKHSIIFPFLALIIMASVFIFMKVFKFIKNYE